MSHQHLSVIKGQVFLGLTCTKLGLMCLGQGHNAVTPVRLKPAAPRSRVKHSTTELSTCTPYCSYTQHMFWLRNKQLDFGQWAFFRFPILFFLYKIISKFQLKIHILSVYNLFKILQRADICT